MLLPKPDVEEFYRLYHGFLEHGNRRRRIVREPVRDRQKAWIDPGAQITVRTDLFGKRDSLAPLLEQYIAAEGGG